MIFSDFFIIFSVIITNRIDSPVFKNRNYVLTRESSEDPPQFHETDAFRSLQEQINQVMTSGSDNLSEELCPLLLAQNAHLQSLLREKREKNSSPYERQLNIAAEGIREQSQVLKQLQTNNHNLTVERKRIYTRLESLANDFNVESDVIQDDLVSLFDSVIDTMISKIDENKNTDGEKESSNKMDEEENINKEDDESEEEEDEERKLEYVFSEEKQEKIVLWMEENKFQSIKLQEISKESQEYVDTLIKLLEELRHSSNNNDESFKPAEEEIKDLAKTSLYLHQQIRELIDANHSFQWFGMTSLYMDSLYQENVSQSEKINSLLGDNAKLLQYSEELISESKDQIRMIDSLQRQISSLNVVSTNNNNDTNESNIKDKGISNEANDLLEKIKSVYGNSGLLLSADNLKTLNYSFSSTQNNSIMDTSLEEFKQFDKSNNTIDNDEDDFTKMINNQKAKEEHEELMLHLNDAINEIKYWKEKVSKQQKQLEQCSCGVKESSEIEHNEIDDDNDTLKTYKEEIDTLTSIVETLTSENETLKKENSDNSEKLSELTTNLKQNQLQIQRQQKTLQQMTKQIATQKLNSNSELLNQKQTIIQQLCNQRDDLGRQLKKITQNNKLLMEEKQRLEDTVQFLKAKCNSTSSPSPSHPLRKDIDFEKALQDIERDNSMHDLEALRHRLTETLQQNKELMSQLQQVHSPNKGQPVF